MYSLCTRERPFVKQKPSRNFRFMKNKVNRALVAEKKQMYLCVDLETQMKRSDLKVMDSRKGTLFRNEEDKFTFTERGARPHGIHPELHWRLLNRTLHGRMSVNANHIKVEFYIRHGEYVSEQQVADMLASEIETMGDALCETDLKEEVEKCC